MGTHHSHGLEIGLKMYLYYQPFMPESFSTSQNNCQISIKTREILHKLVCSDYRAELQILSTAGLTIETEMGQ